jgi:hypothetical protein
MDMWRFLIRNLVLCRFTDYSGPALLPAPESEYYRPHHAQQRQRVIPLHRLSKIDPGKNHEDSQRDHFLHDLQLVGTKLPEAQPVARYLQAILREGDQPTDEDYFPQIRRTMLQVTVPRQCHENVGANQQQYSRHLFVAFKGFWPHFQLDHWSGVHALLYGAHGANRVFDSNGWWHLACG